LKTTGTDKKIAVVVGSSGSIGLAIAKALGEDGYLVIGWQRTNQSAIPLHNIQSVDLTSESSVIRAAEETMRLVGRVDLLVYAAGYLAVSDIADLEVEQWDQMFNVNVRGLFLTAKHLVRLANINVIVPIGSVAAHVGANDSFGYTASKGGMRSLSFALAQLYAPRTRVVLVSPAWVDGGFTDQVREGLAEKDNLDELARQAHLLERMCKPQEVADVVLYVASDKASFMTGTEVMVDGGFIIRR
jgi:NAD(P)-dependent dehydrogenase (short-subunit alcohol dehydrogenase family)